MVDSSSETERLARQLKAVSAETTRKERVSRTVRGASLHLLTAESIMDFVDRVLGLHLAEHQLALSLVLSDPSHELRQLIGLRSAAEAAGQESLELVENIIVFAPPYATLRRLTVIPFDDEQHRILFPGKSNAVVIAMLPLFRDGRLVGVINVASSDSDELNDETLQEALSYLATVASLCLEHAVNRERLLRVGLTDTLTGLSNRRYFDQRMREEIIAAKRYQRPLACLMIDLDHFKRINDKFGHQSGDFALKHVAARVRRVARGSDVVARFGGEEFCVLAPGTGETSAATLAERIRAAVSSTPVILPDGGELDVSVSVGVTSLLPAGGLDDIDLLERKLIDDADQAMYTAKRAGRNCVRSALFAAAVG